MAAEIGRWVEAVQPRGEGLVPLVLVAAAGGGLRAAWWTATALTGLMEIYPGLERHIVAVSGVSGGSLGAAVVSACLAREEEKAQAGARFDRAGVRDCARKVLDNDFLAPTLSALLYTDMLPPALTEPLGLSGRAAALENAWAAAFDRLPGRRLQSDGSWRNPLAGPFLEFGDEVTGCLPILFLSATHEERGRRVVASRERIDQPPFLDVWDLHRLMQRDFWTVTAVHSSARFSFVSPAGLVRGPAPESPPRGHLLDGGYFENFGATTLLETWRAIRDELDKPDELPDSARFLPIVIQITSDPGLAPSDIVTDGACGPPEPLPLDPDDARSPWTLANEALARSPVSSPAARPAASWRCASSPAPFAASRRPSAHSSPSSSTSRCAAWGYAGRHWGGRSTPARAR